MPRPKKLESYPPEFTAHMVAAASGKRVKITLPSRTAAINLRANYYCFRDVLRERAEQSEAYSLLAEAANHVAFFLIGTSLILVRREQSSLLGEADVTIHD